MLEQFKTLDVGCDNETERDVNLDVFKPNPAPRNFVLGDCFHLPFKNNTFYKVTCFHVIEHISNPVALLKELIRVSKCEVEVRCPFRISGYAKNKQHIHYFNKSWFLKTLKNYPTRVFLTLDTERELLWFPIELRVKIWKPKEVTKREQLG